MTRNDRGELPWQLALKVGALVPVVMLLLPAPEHLLWANTGRELAPEVFADARGLLSWARLKCCPTTAD